MIKLSSFLFVFFLACIIVVGFLTVFIESAVYIPLIINIASLGMLIAGILSIIALIVDRYKDAKLEEKDRDDYKDL
ncbi:hypothetical protein ACR6HW_12995 [Fusibacter sp. JL298sf-3]